MVKILEALNTIVHSPQLLLATITISFTVKTYFLAILIPKGLKSRTFHRPWFFALGILGCSLFGDIAWMIKLYRLVFNPAISYTTVTFLTRIAWTFVVLQYQSLAFFIQSLMDKYFKPTRIQQFFVCVSMLIAGYFLYEAFFDTTLISEEERELAKALSTNIPLEINAMRYTVLYILFGLIVPSLYNTFRLMRSKLLPKILRKQLNIFIKYLVCPYLMTEVIQTSYFMVIAIQPYILPLVNFSTILLIMATYYCMHKVMGLRFLNFSSHVTSVPRLNALSNFKTHLEQLSQASSLYELMQVTQLFFNEALHVPLRDTTLLSRQDEHVVGAQMNDKHLTKKLVEEFMRSHSDSVCKIIEKLKILVYDEIAFSHFYEEDEDRNALLNFLDTIDAEIFLPIYAQNSMIAYITVKKGARGDACYNDSERDEMIVFASYLGSSINLLNNKNLDTMVTHAKKLQNELYIKHQEINQYKESIRSFLHNKKRKDMGTKDIGIIFHKNREFVFGNQAAKELIQINLNEQPGHPLSKAFKTIAHDVYTYKAPQKQFAKDSNGNTLVLSGVPHLEQQQVIITVSYPDIADIITNQFGHLQNPTMWDYVLYLETTETGKRINQLVPGTGEVILNFKIALLKTALSKQTALIDVPDDDIVPIVELLHSISLRETLYTLNLQYVTQHQDIAMQLFGTNPILRSSDERPLLEVLHDSGTLFIKNIHLLDLETQALLTEFMQQGLYRPYKGDQKVASNTRILCSTNQNLSLLVRDGKFLAELLHELKRNTLSMPSLIALPTDELFNLADGFAEQAIQAHTFQNLLSLTDKDKQKLIQKQPTSLQELKTRVHQILLLKSKENNLEQDPDLDLVYDVNDPLLIEAARLGKYALKDQKIMSTLWEKFQNQNKIATFLGVNRSSVNRRCREYNLI
ncbi:MAG TPA: sigma 54-interacting transcriptional regulator [Candidatus Dependentiae bacterium]|nr:sigma 54-interacting transcriptional regulator [Candidatus Dependentiae bacterium]HRQ62599.1 sigma 54-interacting transcriptional regulator [Candidatus Dependentiae bacterium]